MRRDRIDSLLSNTSATSVGQTSVMNQFLADGHRKKTKSLSYWWGQKKVRTNLILMCGLWLVTSFDYYLINYMVSHFKRAYSVVITAQITEICSKFAAGILLTVFGTKKSLSTTLIMASAAGMFIAVGGTEL